MKFKLKSICILLVLVFLNAKANAQENKSKHSNRYYAKHPVWIDMMNDAGANYYETIKAFKAYWQKRELPKEAFDSGEDAFEKEIGLKENETEEREKKENKRGVSYAAEVRAFKGWMQSNQAWVKPDGFIMTEQERQDVINRQQAELKEIELKNGKK